MIECEHRVNGECQVASGIAGMKVVAREDACRYCSECEQPRQHNEVTLGIARTAVRSAGGTVTEEMYPPRESPKLLAGDGMGRALQAELPWIKDDEDCDCFSYLRLMDGWGPTRCVAERSRIAGWFTGAAKKMGLEVSGEQVELAIFRAAEKIKSRDDAGIASWPIVWTYYAAGAVGDELRYSIRSVLKYQPGARVIVVGDRPGWYRGEFVPKPRIRKTDFHAFRDCYSKLLLMAERLERYVWHMDDIYWIKPFTVQEMTVPKYVRHVSQARFRGWRPKNTWGKTRLHAYRWLLENHRPTYDFAAHLPQPIVSASFLETERSVRMMTERYRNWECVYFNSYHSAAAEDWGRRYLRVTNKRDAIETRHKVLNHTHSQFRGAVERFLAEQFPDKCAVEK